MRFWGFSEPSADAAPMLVARLYLHQPEALVCSSCPLLMTGGPQKAPLLRRGSGQRSSMKNQRVQVMLSQPAEERFLAAGLSQPGPVKA